MTRESEMKRGDRVLVQRDGRFRVGVLAASPEYGFVLVKIHGVPGSVSVPVESVARDAADIARSHKP